MTRLFGIIGHPIDHSLSPILHTAAFRALGLDALYGAFDVPATSLRSVLRGLLLAGIEGLNVTMPLKGTVLPLLDRVDPEARAIGAVNTIVVRHGRTIGYNTDGIGFRLALKELGWRPRPCCAVVLGAGGAARAVAWELSRVPGGCVAIANRQPARARALARWLSRRRPRVCIRAIPLRAVDLDEADLLVNATTVGMASSDGLLVDPRALRRGMTIYDLVYHRQTMLVREARRRGCVAAGGASMLRYQAGESLRLWLRRPPPLAAMRRALDRALRQHMSP